MKHSFGCVLLLLVAVLVGLAPETASAQSKRYLVLARTETVLPASLAAGITAAGGVVTGVLPEIGVAFAASDDPTFAARAAKIAGVRAVVADEPMAWTEPDPTLVPVEADAAAPLEADAVTPFDERFYPLQWAPRAIHAPEAWAAGATGKGVRVAVLDGAIYDRHVDLDNNLDAGCSVSFVPGFAFNQDVGSFWHGTHVAGIIAAEDNGIGTIGIAPEATLIGVKVLHNGSGAFEWILRGILYAANPALFGSPCERADVVNMSLSGSFPHRLGKDAAELWTAFVRATNYAAQQGVTLIASAGNDALDVDHTKDLVIVPAMAPKVLTISATGPYRWALDPGADPDRPASYTNYGQQYIDLAGPGGDFAYPGNELCTVSGITVPCWVFDMVMSTVRGGPTSVASYNWAAGTSMSAPAVAGVAALIIGQNGGDMKPAQVEQRLRASAVDLGKPGRDDYYGHGRVDAYRAVAGGAAPAATLAGSQNYPNPFNPSTTIRFTLPEGGRVRLVVYDVVGREVARLVDGALDAGPHEVTWNATGLPSGLYLYRLDAGASSEVRRMMLVK